MKTISHIAIYKIRHIFLHCLPQGNSCICVYGVSLGWGLGALGASDSAAFSKQGQCIPAQLSFELLKGWQFHSPSGQPFAGLD